ncbi:phosphatase PAP2 family protein [Pseudotenacibaculum haliotis]|uniref:Phosphatase PAP2 family protein n=1 Tax=Pseudotenacibaculum haliotis TaxID=1862138 RepID=A0ABW5LVW6_9FLAO
MMRSFFLVVIVIAVSINCSYGQKDSLRVIKKDKTFLQENIIPLSLITFGSLISTSQFEKNLQRDVRNLVGNRFNSQLDNYTRYVPLGELLLADALGIKAKNHWFDQAKNWVIAWYLTDLLTFKLKGWVRKPRPDGFDNFSFPSGHTSFAFMNAEVLYNEFKDSSPWLSYSGYFFAGVTGGLRVMNNAHFASDVIVSAGLGMLITKIVYWLDPIIKWNPFKKIEGVTFYPQRYERKVGFYLGVRL